MENKVSLLWGPIRSGKSQLMALVAANCLKAGKKVLYVAGINEHVDDVVLRSVEMGKQIGADVQNTVTCIGLPAVENFEPLGDFSFEHRIDRLRHEKMKTFQERVKLVASYRSVRLKQLLNEDHTLRLGRVRELVNERKKEIDRLTAECNALKEKVNRLQNASMVERLKKGFSKDQLDTAQKQLQERLALLKHLQSSQTTLASEHLKLEATAPVHTDEWKEFQLAQKRIEELGGLAAVEKSIDEYCAVDEGALLAGVRFVGTTIATAISDPRLAGMTFDLVMVDESESVSIPVLAALAARAREQFVAAGDPFQIGPSSAANTPLAHEWLKKDIFLHIAGTDQLNRLFEWSEKNSRWCIFLTSLYATTPKLPLFVASVLYDDKINVFTAPESKGAVYFIDTSGLHSACKQYLGRKKMLPCNELHAAKVLEIIKHVLTQPGRRAMEIGVVVPFPGPTLYLKQQLRLHGLDNIEVGLPSTFRGRRKQVVIFDTTVAGIDYTIRSIDDAKIGEHEIARLLNTVFSCVEEDLYVLADLQHFRTVYRGRLLPRLLLLLQAQSDRVPDTAASARRFDGLDWHERLPLFELYAKVGRLSGAPVVTEREARPVDAETALRIKMMEARQKEHKPQQAPAQGLEREAFLASLRVLGMMTDVNLLSQYIGGDVLFHQSPATEAARRKLPKEIARSEREFASLMDAWNLMLYEMSGGSKTDEALFGKNVPEARARYDVNSLKAFYSSDVAALIEEGKQKIAVSASRVFQESIGKPVAGNPAEWGKAYLHILSKMESYLNWISQQLRQ